MPKLILQFEDQVLKEYFVGESATIGRLPDNTVVIDNPAVSSHHARVYRDGDRFVIEDLKSKNGTYVNEKFVMNRRSLQNGDVIVVGKHRLVFDEAVLVDESEPVLADLGDTVYLDTEEHKAVLARLRQARWARMRPATPPPAKEGGSPTVKTSLQTAGVTAAPTAAGKVGTLRVLAGRSEQAEYKLEAHTSLIGAANEALVRLQGWFKPKVALAIARNGEGYVATPLGGETQVNSQPLSGRYNLKDGDVLQVSGLTLEFRMTG